ncbi:MAG: NADH-quinone oxidoreductase subunit J [Desulfobacteraceae bacterium]|nr:MAG: NADH-quinone oxidoreductase subunit J [Desulfobacteraceae bacterium]
MELLFFYLFAAVAVTSALGVVTLRNPVHSAVCLIICLVQVAALYILLRSPFLAAVQIFIYVGAVMVLFLFAVMTLDIGTEELKQHVHGQSTIAVPAAIFLLAMIGYLLFQGQLSAPPGPYTEAVLARNTEVLGRLLYTKYIFPFEIVSVLLLVALIGAIVLVMREKDAVEIKEIPVARTAEVKTD